MKLAVFIFKIFASFRLAIFLLFAMGLVFSAGTFIESAYGTDAAKYAVYNTPWMSLLLVLLALNLAAAAFDRLPWKQKHVGFVVTHAGIIIILAGSLITQAYGVEGQMAIEEGRTASRIILGEPLLQIFTSETGPLASLKIPPRAFAWKGRKKLHSEPDVWLLQYYPKANSEEKVGEAAQGPAALEVVLASSFMEVKHWLFLDDPDRSQILLGPAELRFTREKFVPQAEEKQPEAGHLEFQFGPSSPAGARSVKIPLDQNPKKSIPLAGTSYKITGLQIFKDARVDKNRLIDQSGDWNNPAAEFILEGNGLKEKHTVFSNFPDFPTIHGMKPSGAGARIFYTPSPLSSPPRRGRGKGEGVGNELRFVWQETGLPIYQIRRKEGILEGTVELGKEHETGWMDFKFQVKNYYPHAGRQTVFSEAPVNSEAEGHLSAVQIEVGATGGNKTLWLGQGEDRESDFGGVKLHFLYGLRTLPVGFRLELKDFRVENYPGTNRPASFESDVVLKDDFTGTVREQNIGMNRPLKYRGFKVFQSGYQQDEGRPEVSIFTVAKDPGIPVKYAGALVLLGGVLTMFYSRRFSNRPKENELLTISQ